MKRTKLLKIGKMQSDAGVTVDYEQVEVVEHFKYLGSLKLADGNCSKDTRSRIGMSKKRMLDLVPIGKDRGINKDLNMKLVRPLVWTVPTYGAEGWTRGKADEKRIESAELWIYRRRSGSRAGSLVGGAPQLTWRHTCTDLPIPHTHACPRAHACVNNFNK